MAPESDHHSTTSFPADNPKPRVMATAVVVPLARSNSTVILDHWTRIGNGPVRWVLVKNPMMKRLKGLRLSMRSLPGIWTVIAIMRNTWLVDHLPAIRKRLVPPLCLRMVKDQDPGILSPTRTRYPDPNPIHNHKRDSLLPLSLLDRSRN
jgi:hypothetical protein